MHRVFVVGDIDVPVRQLLAKSYRSRTGCPQGRRERGDLLGEIRGSSDERLPKTLAAGCVEGRKDLTATGVKNGQASGCLLANGTPECIESADAADLHARACSQAPGRRQPDPDADKRPRPAADGNPSHLLPTAARLRRALYLGEQGGRVLRASVGR